MFELQLVMTGAAEAAGVLCDGDGGVVSVGGGRGLADLLTD